MTAIDHEVHDVTALRAGVQTTSYYQGSKNSAFAKRKTKTEIGASLLASRQANSRDDGLPAEGGNIHKTSNSIGLKSVAMTGRWLTEYGSVPRRMSSSKR